MTVFFPCVTSLPDNNVVCFTRHEPIGVCGAITPVSMDACCHRLFLPLQRPLAECSLEARASVPEGDWGASGCLAGDTVDSSRVARSGLLLWDGESLNWSCRKEVWSTGKSALQSVGPAWAKAWIGSLLGRKQREAGEWTLRLR